MSDTKNKKEVKDTKVETASLAKEPAKKERTTRVRPKREIRVSMDALKTPGPQSVPESWKEPGFVYRWMNSELNKGKRFAFLYEKGWDFALDPQGKKITAGGSDYLLEMPQELFDEWQEVSGKRREKLTAAREEDELNPDFTDAGIIKKQFTLNR